MYKHVSRILHSLLFIIFVGTWSSIVYYVKNEARVNEPGVRPVETFAPTPVLSPSITATVETTPDSGWSLLKPGLERRVINIYDDQNQQVESLHIWRLDQTYFRLDVVFDETPKSLEDWQKQTNAALVINGGYFSIDNKRYSPDGLTIVNGDRSGSSFTGFGGMLAIDPARAELRSLVEKPYNSGEPLRAALQSFPILVKPGGQLGFSAERENHASARRTVIGQDRQGRILFIVAPLGHFTLHELSVYLTDSDLNLDIAINLDGGGSTGILLANPHEIIASKVLLPFVILVYPR